MEPDVSSVKQNYECQTVEKLQVLGQSTDQSGNINSEKGRYSIFSYDTTAGINMKKTKNKNKKKYTVVLQ